MSTIAPSFPGPGDFALPARPIAWQAYAWAVLPAVAIMVLGAASPWPLGELTRDQSALVFANNAWAPWYGIISNIGIAVFFAAAGILLISYVSAPADRANARNRAFLLFGFLFTAWLAIDDMFQFHESVPDMLVAAGWPAATAHRGEKIVYGSYVAAAAAYLWLFRGEAARLGGLPLVLMTFALFGISCAVDGYFYHFFDWQHMGEVWLEDGSKLVGQNCWIVAQIIMCRAVLTGRG